ncbi:MAG: hypothetical protein PHQ75_04910, partial [Thermoguttaceae bacterium]|nr:hypothetical protein [Thermoguttaceae bacterium]
NFFTVADLHYRLVSQFLLFKSEEGDVAVSHLLRVLELLDKNPPVSPLRIMTLRLETLTRLLDALPRSSRTDLFPTLFAAADTLYSTMDKEMSEKFLFNWIALKTREFFYHFWNDRFDQSGAIANRIEDMEKDIAPSKENEIPDHMKWFFHYPQAMQLVAKGRFWAARCLLNKCLTVVKKRHTAQAAANKATPSEEIQSEISLLCTIEHTIHVCQLWSYYKQDRHLKVRNLIQAWANEYKFALSDLSDFSKATIVTSYQVWAYSRIRRYDIMILCSQKLLNEFANKKRFLNVSDEQFLAKLLCDRAEAYWRKDQIEMALCDCDEACQALTPLSGKGFFFIDILLAQVLLLRARLTAACDLPGNSRDDLHDATEILDTLPSEFRPKEVRTLRADFDFLNTWLGEENNE